jgi:hypothetical protein
MAFSLWHTKKIQIATLNRGFAGRPIQLDGYNGKRIVVDSKTG